MCSGENKGENSAWCVMFDAMADESMELSTLESSELQEEKHQDSKSHKE